MSDDPHFAKKVASIRSMEELNGFQKQLTDDRKAAGSRVFSDELAMIIKQMRRIQGDTA